MQTFRCLVMSCERTVRVDVSALRLCEVSPAVCYQVVLCTGKHSVKWVAVRELAQLGSAKGSRPVQVVVSHALPLCR